MLLENKVLSVQRLYRQVDKHVIAYKTNLDIQCEPGCGECCLKNDVEATILEFMPAAYHLYMENAFENVLDHIENDTSGICIFYNSFLKEGFCSQYQYRGLICRLFGYSARNDKYNQPVIVTCRIIKNKLIQISRREEVIKRIPLISAYYLKLYAIDPSLASKTYPINKAIKKAFEIILLHFNYKKKKLAG